VDSSGRPLACFVVRGVAGDYVLANFTEADGAASFWGLAPDVVDVFDRDRRLVQYGTVTSLDITVVVHSINTAVS